MRISADEIERRLRLREDSHWEFKQVAFRGNRPVAPNNLTVDDLPDRQSTRNELLAAVLGRMPVAGIKGADDRLFVMGRRGDGIRVIQRETRALGGGAAVFRLIGDAELCVVLPAANTEPDSTRVAVSMRHAGAPLGGVEVLVLFPNETSTRATTDLVR